MRPRRSSARAQRARCGLTLVEATLLVCVAGIMLAVGIPAFVRALHTSKLSEPPSELGRIYASVAAYYEATTTPGAASERHCMPSSAGPTPDKPSRTPVEVHFADPANPAAATWSALQYEPAGPIRYRYSLEVARAGCGVARDHQGQFAVSIRAEGDLDGDGVLSLFERNASLDNGSLRPDPLLVMRDAVE